MDIVLSVADGYVFDSLYASALATSSLAFAKRECAAIALSGNVCAGLSFAREAILRQSISLFALTCTLSPPRLQCERRMRSIQLILFPPFPPVFPSCTDLSSVPQPTDAGIFFLYFGFAIGAFYFLFDHRIMQHPRFLKGQIRQEIKISMDSFVPVGLMTLPWFVGDVRGHSMLYTNVADGPLGGGVAGWVYLALSATAFLLFTDYLIYWVHRALHHPLLYKKIHKSHHRFISETSRFSLASISDKD